MNVEMQKIKHLFEIYSDFVCQQSESKIDFNNFLTNPNDKSKTEKINSQDLKMKKNFTNRPKKEGNFKRQVIIMVFDVWNNIKGRNVDLNKFFSMDTNLQNDLKTNFLYCLQFNSYFVEKFLGFTCFIMANESKYDKSFEKFAKYDCMLALFLDKKDEMNYELINELFIEYKDPHAILIYFNQVAYKLDQLDSDDEFFKDYLKDGPNMFTSNLLGILFTEDGKDNIESDLNHEIITIETPSNNIYKDLIDYIKKIYKANNYKISSRILARNRFQKSWLD